MDFFTLRAPREGAFPRFDCEEVAAWEEHLKQNAEEIAREVEERKEFVRQCRNRVSVADALEIYWDTKREFHRIEQWERWVTAMIGQYGWRPGAPLWDSRIEGLRTENKELRAETQLLRHEGETLHVRVQRLEFEQSQTQPARVCTCGHLTYITYCPRCLEVLS
ncbi:MAG TPA: hypothetical protein VKD90_05045 [Gemmataceae bacterium]|nr:hypothetical protein [Gemmataceae bacterium]